MKQLALAIGLASNPTLENFLPGDNGQVLAYLRQTVSGATAQPTYLWGETGTGKTHLLRAAAAQLCDAGARVGWLDAATLQPQAFDDAWSAVFLDQVHAYDAAQQAVAFNWFVNATSPALGPPRWVLAAGRLPPADLALRDDLRSRLGWGQIFQLRPPDEAQCRAILRAQAAARGIHLPNEVLNYMLVRFARDLGSLVRLLDALDGFALRTQRAVTVALLRAMLDDGATASQAPEQSHA